MNGKPTVWGWLRLSTARRFSTGRSVFLISCIPVMVLAALVVPVVQATAVAIAQAEGESVLTQIRVMRPEGSEPAALLEPDLASVRTIANVIGMLPEDAATLYSCQCGDAANWGATVLVVDPGALPDGVPVDAARNLSANQVIVPSAMEGEDMTQWVGRTMPATYSQMVDEHTGEMRSIAVDVVASYPSTWSAPYPDTVFATEELLIRLLAAQSMVPEDKFLERVGFSRVVVNVGSTAVVDQVADELREMGLDAFPLRDRLGGLPETIEMVPVLIALVGFATLISATAFIVFAVRSTLRKREQEFGLLRLRGWTKATVFRLVVGDVSLGVAAGATLGALLGFGAGTLLAGTLLGQSGPPQASASALLGIWVGVIALSTLTALICTWVGLRRDPFIAIMTPA